jgi:DNA methylase
MAGIENKAVDARLQTYEREIIGEGKAGLGRNNPAIGGGWKGEYPLTTSATNEAKALDGAYAGFQPKPAVEVIIVAMKPLSEKTYVEQALKNGKGITWLDEGRIPFQGEEPSDLDRPPQSVGGTNTYAQDKWTKDPANWPPRFGDEKGRFPANLIASDDVLNDGQPHTSGDWNGQETGLWAPESGGKVKQNRPYFYQGDSGSFSRYFSLDAWFSERIKELPQSVRKTFPFLIEPKASKDERNEGLENLDPKSYTGRFNHARQYQEMTKLSGKNHHPTVKPLAIMSYLVTLGSRRGDTVLDPFAGSGTTLMAAKMLGRKGVGFEINPDYAKIADARIQSLATIEEWVE